MVLTLGARVKQLRLRAGLSQKELAESVSISPSYIGHLERGTRRMPSKEILKALAPALGTTIEDLLSAADYIDKTAGSSLDEMLTDPMIQIHLRNRRFLNQDDQELIRTIYERAGKRARKNK